jgi:hypothetical protein
VDEWPFDLPSTKAAVASLEALGLSGRVLVVLGDEDGYADRSFGNLPHVQTMVAGELNAYDILVNDWVVFTDETLPGGAGGDGRSSPAGDAAEEAGDTVVAEEAAGDVVAEEADDTVVAEEAADDVVAEEAGSAS